MEFLVRADTHLPPEMPEDDRLDLLEHEARRGRQLADAGLLRHIWRLPGRLSNIAVWNVTDAEQLHELLCSLPLWRWMDVEVIALATHPLSSPP